MFRAVNRIAVRSSILRRAAASTALTGALLLPHLAQAQTVPTGGMPSAGEVTIGTPTGNANGGLDLTMTTSGRAIIDWSTFNVGQFDRVIFNQRLATSATLNRVVGDTASTIAGQITSNGSIYLVNPNGIAITATGTVQTGGGFIASTLGITSTAFLNGSNVFTGAAASAAVSNAGSITASGFAALLGGTVSNAGTISVPAGRVALGSGEAITLDINGANFLSVATPTAATTADGVALIESAGTITGGRIALSVASAADAVRRVVNVSGTINADSATGNAGSILLSAVGPAGAVGGGVVSASGTLSAQATGTTGNGGTITLSGGTVTTEGLTASTRAAGINGATGTLTLRQQGTYTASGTNKGNLADLLSTNNVTVATTAGDIVLPDTLFWMANTALTLDSARNIALNGAISLSFNNPPFPVPSGALNLAARGSGAVRGGTITSTGEIYIGLFNLTNGNWAQNTATLPAFRANDFRFTQSNATFLRAAGGNGSPTTPYRIADVYGLQGMASSNQLAGNFVLANDIDASGTVNWNGGEGFVGIGTNSTSSSTFAGTLSGADGSGGRYTIAGLTQNRATTGGLFDTLIGTVSDLNLTQVSIIGTDRSGALVGNLQNGAVRNVDVAGKVSGVSIVGGLVASNLSGTIENVRSSVIVVGTSDFVGGLVGSMNGGKITRGVVTQDASVRGRGNVGGLIGSANNYTVIGSSTASTVNGTGVNVGGLVGVSAGGTRVSDSSATGNVTGANAQVGGLIGRLAGSGGFTSDITNSFATGDVSGNSTVGGLIGQVAAGTGIVRIVGSYAAGKVASTNTGGGFGTGGLVGILLAGSVIDSFATGAVSTNGNYTGGLIGDMQARASVSGSYATGDVTNASNGTITAITISTGGLVGRLDSSVANATTSIANSFATGRVTGSSNLGGLVGVQNATAGGSATIAGSYATGAVRATSAGIGGLVGQIAVSGATLGTLASVTTSYATGAVSTTLSGNVATQIGGLVGYANRGSSNNTTISINNAYATGAVSSGGNNVGGLIGLTVSSTVNNVYATGTVKGVDSVGGLIGSLNTGSVLSNAYASGMVTGSVIVGGLLGSQASTATTSAVYWDSYSTGRGSAFGSGPAGAGGIEVSSDPGVRSAYVPGSYAFAAATGIGTATPTGFVFLAGNSTRPFLAFEVPTAARAGAVPTDLASVRTIASSHELQLINYNAETLSGNYRMAANIDLSETGRIGSGIVGSTDRANNVFGAVAANTPGAYSGMWAPTGFVSLGTDGAGNVWNGTAFVPLAANAAAYGYGGTFDGGGFALSGLSIVRPTAAYTGLFGVTNGRVQNVTVTGSVSGAGTTGGLVGFLYRGGRVTGSSSAVNVRASGTVVGGLIGSAGSGTLVRFSNASGTVSGTTNVGGLIGYASEATVDRNFATGAASGTSYIGGLIGYSYLGTTIDSYARGAASASNTSAGGLIGKIVGGSVARTYSSGAVTAATRAGGLIGAADASANVSASYWDTQTSNQAVSAGGMGRTTAQMQDPATYAGWDFGAVWTAPTATTYLTLRPATQQVQ